MPGDTPGPLEAVPPAERGCDLSRDSFTHNYLLFAHNPLSGPCPDRTRMDGTGSPRAVLTARPGSRGV